MLNFPSHLSVWGIIHLVKAIPFVGPTLTDYGKQDTYYAKPVADSCFIHELKPQHHIDVTELLSRPGWTIETKSSLVSGITKPKPFCHRDELPFRMRCIQLQQQPIDEPDLNDDLDEIFDDDEKPEPPIEVIEQLKHPSSDGGQYNFDGIKVSLPKRMMTPLTMKYNITKLPNGTPDDTRVIFYKGTAKKEM